METYKTSWVRRLVDNVWTKTFAFAHAKTVYTDYANKKTLADKLSGVDLEIAQQSTEMMDIKMLGWSVPRECPVQNEINGNQFVQKVGRVDLGSLRWDYESSIPRYYTSALKSSIKAPENDAEYFTGYLKDYKSASLSYLYSDSTDKVIAVSVGANVSIKDKSYTDVITFKSVMQGQYLYYELADPIVTTMDGNEEVVEIAEDVNTLKKETIINLLNPTFETTTQGGVTCTNNGDGTFTINGTASTDIEFVFGMLLPDNKKYRVTGCPENGSLNTVMLDVSNYVDSAVKDTGNGVNITLKGNEQYRIQAIVKANYTAINLVFKPMVTTNLDATYDDFVPYTGSTGSLNGDVADLRSDVDNIYNYEATEKEIGKFEGKTLYKSTGIFDFSTPITFNAGDKKAFGSSAGIYALASSSNVGFKLNEISKVLNSECFAETSGYFFTNPFIIINDKTGYLWCKNISGEQISATKIIFTLSYTK